MNIVRNVWRGKNWMHEQSKIIGMKKAQEEAFDDMYY